MSETILDAARAALARVRDPISGADLISAGLVKGLTVREGRVGFVLEVDATHAQSLVSVRAEAERVVAALPGVRGVTAVLTSQSGAEARSASRPSASSGQAPARGVGLSPRVTQQAAPRPGQGKRTAGVARTLAVASGKGGVGKSTIAANLACAWARQGKRVGLLDADVYGPSQPVLFGLSGQKPTQTPEGKIAPLLAHGVKVMSVGFLVAPDKAMIWRGPIVSGTLTQLFDEVDWAPLDILIIDMPPGTGDAHLTLAQRAPLDGAVIVSTPQELALADVRRGAAMFEKTHVPMLGIIENMSARTDPETGAVFAPFGAGGARKAAEALGVPFLGAVPLEPDLAALSDAGTPPAAVRPDSPIAVTFRAFADGLWAGLEAGTQRTPPTIEFV